MHQHQRGRTTERSSTYLTNPPASPPRPHIVHNTMRLPQLQRPLQAAVITNGGYRPVMTTFTLPIRPVIPSVPVTAARSADGSAFVAGRRYASVKAQGAYRIPNKKTLAKKLGAKRTGGMFSSVELACTPTATCFCARRMCTWIIDSTRPEDTEADNFTAMIHRPVCHPRQHHLQAARHHLAPW